MPRATDEQIIPIIASPKHHHQQQAYIMAKEKPFRSKKTMLALSLLILMTGFIASYANAAENLYAKNYKAQNNGGLMSMQPQPNTEIFVSNHSDEDNISMLERGYDMMGSSGFESGDTSPDLALAHGQSIKADVVLVYSKYGSAKTGSAKMDMIREAAKTGKELTEKDMAAEPTVYKYYASYWAKLPTPVLGVHIIKLTPKTGSEATTPIKQGLTVLAVIKDSPAAIAGLQRNDQLISVNKILLEKPEQLSETVKKFRGQVVAIDYIRDNETLHTQAKLN